MYKPLMLGYNVNKIDIEAGLRELERCGYDDPYTTSRIHHALVRCSKGDELEAYSAAIDISLNGIDLASWYRVLSAAIDAGKGVLCKNDQGR